MWAKAPLVVLVRVLEGVHRLDGRYSGRDVEVIEVLRGDPGQSRLRVWGGGGWLCRREVDDFLPGSQWVLALDGPGAKPGVTGGHALSSCGCYWLETDGTDVWGNICNSEEPGAVQRAPLSLLRCPGRTAASFAGEVAAGGAYERAFGPGFVFRLEPVRSGWSVRVFQDNGSEDISRLTPPLHGVNHRDIKAWHFRNADNSGPNVTGEKNVNAPGTVREFSFSTEVPALAVKELKEPARIFGIQCFGRGRLEIKDYHLVNLEAGMEPAFASMKFEVELSWPSPCPRN